jgi:hypothetical protein
MKAGRMRLSQDWMIRLKVTSPRLGRLLACMQLEGLQRGKGDQVATICK